MDLPRSRPPTTPRWLWILSLSIGAACAIAFIVAAVRGSDGASTESTAAPAAAGSGFPTGLILGVGVGIVIGYFVGRRAQAPDHSSRKMP
ncbi:MAG: hypothetical protein H0T46_20270 [Deltaproteobacteria bacterium]|nr:hypothetical protein [Deltaproteobacteria bacterium]